MSVKAMLKTKGHDIFKVSADRTMEEVCGELAAKRVGAVVVLDGERLVGILSERDVVRAIAAHGSDALQRPVSEFMTGEVEVCHPSDTTEEVMRKMTSGRFRHMPVLKKGALVGVISIGDVVKERIAEAEREAAHIREYITAG